MNTNLVETNPITLELRRSGVTSKRLEVARFWKAGYDLPFEQWPITFPGSIEKGLLSHLRAYCALKWLIHTDPPACPQREAAYQLVSEMRSQLQFVTARQARLELITHCEATRQAQQKRAQQPRPITADGRNLKALVIELCSKPDNREATASELWPKLFSLLDEQRLDPDDRDRNYIYVSHRGRDKSISFRSFANLVSKARRPPSH